MLQIYEAANDMDGENPSGGQFGAIGIKIEWQRGPVVGEVENGAHVETVIQAAIQRLEFYQNSKFKCWENEEAIFKLQGALRALDHRTRGRKMRGVEGTHEL